ncbi:MAG: hypothetical protein IIC92_08230 [Chloroflexi bacterium]|nr:hypothetical protein [Chloroflexota bacterium]
MLTRIHLLLPLLAIAALVVASCSGGGDEATDSTPAADAATSPALTEIAGTAATVTPQSATATPEPEFGGYALDLSEGDFWEYRWTYLDSSCAQGSGCSSKEDEGVFQVTLGERREIEGVPVYELVVTGKRAVGISGETRDFGPRWRYLGVTGDRIVVSNGGTLTTLFDGGTGKWAGSGFFTDRFDGDELIVARSGSLTDGLEISDWPGVRQGPWEFVGRAASQSVCETIAGHRICPREESFSFTENEYYRAEIGPVAYRFSNTASFSGGGFFSSYQTTEWVALVASSLRGDAAAPTPTPVPPTATPVPAPTPPDLADLAPVFGPAYGSLLLEPGSTQIPDFSSGVSLDRAIVQVVFTIPDIAGDRWSQGLTFRQSEEETFHAIYFTGDGRWGHFARTGSVSSESDLDGGTASFDTTPGGSILVTLVFGGTEGLLFFNGELVAELDLGISGVRDPGDVRVMSGLLATDLIDGSESVYSGFTIWTLE